MQKSISSNVTPVGNTRRQATFDPLKVASINLLPFDQNQYEDSKLKTIIDNEDDERNINHYKNDSNIRKSLKSMRQDDCLCEYKLMRVIGINPESILNQHVQDSFVPGEKYVNGTCDESHDHSYSHDSMEGFHFDDSESVISDGGFELAKFLIIIPGSTTHALWRFIFITCCLISPYFYAWISLHGHGRLN